MNIWEIAKGGAKLADPHGTSSAFYPKMFVKTRQDWIKKMNALRVESDAMFDECYPTAYNGGNAGPVGDIQISKHDGFVYVYLIGYRGEWDSRFFTHEVIAGDYTVVPPYGGFGQEDWHFVNGKYQLKPLGTTT